MSRAKSRALRPGASESAARRFVGESAGVCSANAIARLADVLCGVMESSVAAIVICCCNSALHRSKQGNAAGSARTARRGVEQTAHRPMCVREAAARFGARVRPCGCVCGEWTRFPSCDSTPMGFRRAAGRLTGLLSGASQLKHPFTAPTLKPTSNRRPLRGYPPPSPPRRHVPAGHPTTLWCGRIS